MKTRLDKSGLLIEIWSDVEIIHRAFQLEPDASLTRPVVEMLGERYGISKVRAMMDHVSKTATDAGLSFRLEETMTGNTLNAHRLLLWAQGQGDAQPLLAVAVGYPQDEVSALLAGADFTTEVKADQVMAASLGANGVPFFVIDRKYGVSGAQPVEVFASVLAKASS